LTTQNITADAVMPQAAITAKWNVFFAHRSVGTVVPCFIGVLIAVLYKCGAE
jgi:hypothetical protein